MVGSKNVENWRTPPSRLQTAHQVLKVRGHEGNIDTTETTSPGWKFFRASRNSRDFCVEKLFICYSFPPKNGWWVRWFFQVDVIMSSFHLLHLWKLRPAPEAAKPLEVDEDEMRFPLPGAGAGNSGVNKTGYKLEMGTLRNGDLKLWTSGKIEGLGTASKPVATVTWTKSS